MSRRVSILLVLAVLAAFVGYALWKIFLAPSGLPPEGFARGNGRVEADLVDVSPRLSGRVARIAVQEGDLVAQGDRVTNQMPEPGHSVPKRLDRCAKQQQHDRYGVLLGECRFKLTRG